MKRFKLVVAYDGTNYSGWQVQPAANTIEGELNKALSGLTGEEIMVIGASRTDAGVHAFGNVAVFDSDTPIPGEKLLFALNPRLPEDIRIVKSEQVAEDFHPRFCDTRKTYEYHICTGRVLLPTKRLYCHWTPRHLDVEAMKEAGKYLEGEHDFKSFCAAGAQVKTTVRTITRVEVEEAGGEAANQDIIIRVQGEGFLYNMVRIISGTLLRAGLHMWPPGHMKEILEGCDRSLAGETAPAKGLFLKKIEYL